MADKPIWFCVTAKSGLGHLRRVTNIASIIKLNAPGRPLALMTNAPVAGLTTQERDYFGDREVVPREQMGGRLKTFRNSPVVVDTAVVPGLADVDAPLCLILRETKTDKLTHFRLQKNRQWDLVIVPNPVEQWRPDAALLPARRVENVGWIFRTNTAKDYRQLTDERNKQQSMSSILLVSGGGGTMDTANEYCKITTRLVASVRHLTQTEFRVVQVVGPRADPNAVITGVDEVATPGARLPELLEQADIVVSTVGYNSVLELAQIDVPTLLIPIKRSYDDQCLRARRWGPSLGLAHIDLQQSTQWIARLIDNPQRRPRIDINSSGASVAADLVGNLAA